MTAIPTWHAAALCRTEPGDWFADSPALVEQAKAVCGRCAVAERCLTDAVARGERWAIQGGLTADERVAQFGRTLRHGERSTYTAGCHCLPCRRANAAYAADLRSRRRFSATRGGVLIPIRTLERPAGRGHGRAWPGQLAIEWELAA